MAVYRFRISFEDYDDIVREVDVKSNQTFADLHKIIHQSTGYNTEAPSSFYVSNDQWNKGEEITYLPNQKRIDRGISLMEKVKLSNFIDDPHQKFYYTYNFDRPYDFHVELTKILLNETPGVTYPAIIKSIGEAPKQFVTNFTPAASPEGNEDFDFLNEMEFSPEDAEDFDEVNEEGSVGSARSHQHNDDDTEEDQEDEMDEFSDNENFDEGEDNGRGRHDDY